MIGIGIGINWISGPPFSPFSPASLFANGEQGAWLDPSDLSTLFQDTRGTTPVTAPGDPVGFQLDRSQGAGYSGGEFTGLGSELVTNGTFDTDSDWTDASTAGAGGFTISGGVITIYGALAPEKSAAVQAITTTVGSTYFVDFTRVSGTTHAVRVGSTLGGSEVVARQITPFVFVATGTTSYLQLSHDNSSASVTFDNVSVRELPGHHATQATAAQRPTYQDAPGRLELDKVDDRLVVTVPAGGWTGSMVLATTSGTATYGVTIPAGPYEVGGKGGLYFPGSAMVGAVIRDGVLSPGEAASVEAHMVDAGATDSYGGVVIFDSFWRDFTSLTSFPEIDTSSGANFFAAWYGCSGLTGFPVIDTSSGTNFSYAWYGCSGLTSFPIIDTSSGTNFRSAWHGCSGLTSFPEIDTSSGTNFDSAWRDCTGLTSFPEIDTSSGTNFDSAWRDCTGLTSFPAGVFDTCPATNFGQAFVGCALTQTSVDNILVSINAAGTSGGTLNVSGGTSSAPSATGIAAKNSLIGRGWTVTTN